MSEYFEIFGTLIRYSEIKDFRIIQREYIYRPTYCEEIKGVFKARKITFTGMQPYAAIIGENGSKSNVAGIEVSNLKQAAGKDFLEDIRTTIGDKFNIKAIRSRKFTCVNQTGRVFTTYLEDVPALLGREDGKFSDVKKNDELYASLGEPIAPAINIVPALWIKANEEYVFYGNGIQLENVVEEFHRLKLGMESCGYMEQLEDKGKGKPGLFGKISKTVSLPKRKQPLLEERQPSDEITKLKRALEDQVITQEEYKQKLAKIIEKL